MYLLLDSDMQVRHLGNKHYMQSMALHGYHRAAHCALDVQGGPVLMLQVENGYASFGSDLSYLRRLRDMWETRGIKGPFYIPEGLEQLRKSGTYLEGASLGWMAAPISVSVPAPMPMAVATIFR